MTPQEALALLEQGAANLIDYPSQATRAYHVRIQEAVKVLHGLLPNEKKKQVAPATQEEA